jgi:S1-C subfamily serine protease
MRPLKPILFLVLVLALSGLACQALVGGPASPPPTAPAIPPAITQVFVPEAPVIQSPPVDLMSSQDTLIQLYRKVNSGVVSIQVLTDQGGGLGSGFVIDDQGHILTNYHVVEGETDLEVSFSSGYKVRGEVIGTDLDSDLAVVKVDAPAEELNPLAFGDSDLVQVGQTVIAIGNPFGLSGTMTVGIVSGLGRTLQSMHSTADGGTFSAGDIIQTDAAINPGNSGGPLINLNGEVIGINQAIRTNNVSASGDPLNSGVGFAIPINIVKRVTPSLIANGSYDYPYLGITSTNEISLIEQEALGLSTSNGVYITGVTPGTPADRAGLRAGTRDTSIIGLQAGGDLIVAIDNQPVRNFNDLISYLTKYKGPGDTVTLTVQRGDQEVQVDVVLDKRPEP